MTHEEKKTIAKIAKEIADDLLAAESRQRQNSVRYAMQSIAISALSLYHMATFCGDDLVRQAAKQLADETGLYRHVALTDAWAKVFEIEDILDF